MTDYAAEPNIVFNYDEDTTFELTHGDCWFLALLLSKRLPDVTLTAMYGQDSGDNHRIQHLAVQLPNSLIVDIEGIWDEQMWAERWMDELDFMWDVYHDDVNVDDEGYTEALAAFTDCEKAASFSYGEDISLGDIVDEIILKIEDLS